MSRTKKEESNDKPKRPVRGAPQSIVLGNRVSNRQPIRLPEVPTFTPSEINQVVEYLLRSASNERLFMLEFLNRFLALTEPTLYRLIYERVGISDNHRSFGTQLSRYRRNGLIVNVGLDVIDKVIKAGLQPPDSGYLRAYHLGAVGDEYVRRKGLCEEWVPKMAIDERTVEHDLLCAEAMIKMQISWPVRANNPGNIQIRGARELLIWDDKNEKAIIAPDGLLIKSTLNGVFDRAFLVEYQNAYIPWLYKIEEKVIKYEKEIGGNTQYWKRNWELPEQPWVLLIYHDARILEQFRDVINELETIRCNYASIALADIWAGGTALAPIRKAGEKAG